jgi:hypothetical protein
MPKEEGADCEFTIGVECTLAGVMDENCHPATFCRMLMPFRWKRGLLTKCHPTQQCVGAGLSPKLEGGSHLSST